MTCKFLRQFLRFSSISPTAQQVQHPDLQTGLPLHCLPLKLSQKAPIFTATAALICTEQGFVVSFPVPVHHPTSELGLHHLCCLPNAPREFNHPASLHLEPSLFFILAWIYTLTSWIFNIPPTHTQRDNFSTSPAPGADPLKHMNQRLPAAFLQCYLTTALITMWRNKLKHHCMADCSPVVLLFKVISTPNAGSLAGRKCSPPEQLKQGDGVCF